MITRQSLLFFTLAMVFGLTAVIFANRWVKNQVESNVVTPVTESKVVVAARNITYGAIIGAEDLKVVNWPENLLPKETISETNAIIGKIANQQMIAGEPVLAPRIMDKLSGSTLSSMISPSKRAITVRVNDVIGVAGFLLPGNHVDVLATRLSSGRAITRTALQNLKVLAVDQTASQSDEQPVVVRAVTLEADPKQAVELVKATEEGTVQLVLRNPMDAYSPLSAGKNKSAHQKPPTTQSTTTITVIRGVNVKNTRVRL